MPPSKAENHKRLHDLAQSAGIDVTDPPERIGVVQTRTPLLVSRKDRWEAQRLVVDAARKTRTLSILHRHAGLLPHLHQFKHVEKALCDHVQDGGSAPIAQALIDSLLWAKKGEQRTRTPNVFVLQPGLLTFAARLKNQSLVRVLASHSDSRELNSALRASVEIDEPAIQTALLRAGADPNSLCDYLIQAIESNDTPMLSTLLRDENRLRPQSLESCLKCAIRVANVDAVRYLLGRPNDVNKQAQKSSKLGWARDSMLRMAIRRHRYHILLTIALHTVSHPVYDGTLYSSALQSCGEDPTLLLQMMEIILCLDTDAKCATGFWQSNTAPFDEGFANTKLLSLLTFHDVPLSGHAFKVAAQNGDLNLFIQLLIRPVENGLSAWQAVESFPTRLQCSASEQVITRLTQGKARGEGWVDDALIYAVEMQRVEWVSSLLSAGASTNYKSGEALEIALEQHQEAILDLLLRRPCSDEVLANLICPIQRLQTDAQRHFVSILLERSFPRCLLTPILDDALHNSPNSRDRQWIHQLISKGVPCSDASIRSLLEDEDLTLLQQFLACQQNRPFVTGDMQFVVPLLSSIDRPDLREVCFQVLDTHLSLWGLGDHGACLDDYFDFLEVFRTGPVDSMLVNLFGKFQRFLRLSHQSEITAIIVCSQPFPIAQAFVRSFRVGAHKSLTGDPSLESQRLILRVADFYFADDRAKAANLGCIFQTFNGTHGTDDMSERCLEAHCQALASFSQERIWPSPTVHLLLSRLKRFDNHFYSCIRLAAFHEQIKALDCLLKRLPSKQLIGGDLLRPLLRYDKHRSLRYLLSQFVSPDIAIRTYAHCRAEGLDATAVLVLKSTGSDCRQVCCCVKGWAQMNDEKALMSWISNDCFSPKQLALLWRHLDPKPFEPKKHRFLVVLLKTSPRRQLVRSILIRAVGAGDFRLCEVILTQGASLEETKSTQGFSTRKTSTTSTSPPIPTNQNCTLSQHALHEALACAIGHGNVKMCELLLHHGASIQHNGYSILSQVISSNTTQDLAMLASLIAHTELQLQPHLRNECLWRAAVFNKHIICAWLLNSGASPMIRGYGPLRTAADRGLVELLQMFVQHQDVSHDALQLTFRSSFATTLRSSVPLEQRLQVARILLNSGIREASTLKEALMKLVLEENPPIELAQLLIDSGADVEYDQGQCLVISWRAGHIRLVKLLCQGQGRLSISGPLFRQACLDYRSAQYGTVDMLEVVAFILGLGIPQPILDTELTHSLEGAVEERELNMELVNLLVNRGATLDPASARSLYLACLLGDDVFVRTAMRHGPTKEARLEALSLFFSKTDDRSENDLSCFSLLVSQRDVIASIEIGTLVGLIKTFLETRRNTSLLGDLLSDCGSRGRGFCLAESICSHPQEFENLLRWAIIQPSQKVSSQSVSILMKCAFSGTGFDRPTLLEFKSLKDLFGATALRRLFLLALKRGRPSLIPVMIQLGASPSTKDDNGKSALTIAIEQRYLRAAHTIFSAGTDINDGSLHAAVCAQDVQMVRRLKKQGHTSTSRPAAFNGRTVLEVFLRHEHQDAKGMKDTLKALTGGIEKPGLWVSSPSHLFVALQSKMPYDMTVALLENIPRQKRNVDDLFIWKRRYFSALSWVEKDKCQHLAPEVKPKLMEYLQLMGYQRVYYSMTGPFQPVDAVGVPLYLLEKENDRQRQQAFLEKVCAVCGDKPENHEAVHAPLTSSCTSTHSWRNEIICTDCVAGHIMAQIFPDGPQNLARTSPRCWAAGCRSTLSHMEVKSYVDPSTFAMYDEKLTIQLLHSSSQSARCANTTISCPGGAWFSTTDLDDLTFFRCPVCQELTCLQCNCLYEPSHLAAPCPVGLHRKREEEDEKSEEAVRKMSKECECGARIQKSDGCDHMTCNQCGREWCYDCLVPYADIRGGDNSAHLSTCSHYRGPGG